MKTKSGFLKDKKKHNIMQKTSKGEPTDTLLDFLKKERKVMEEIKSII